MADRGRAHIQLEPWLAPRLFDSALLCAEEIGLAKLRYPLNMYLMVYLTVFIWRFTDGVLIMFAINRDNIGDTTDGYMYFATNNISSIVDRFT
jgi:hypothetical protein